MDEYIYVIKELSSSIIAVILSIATLFYAIKTYLLKSGADIRGIFFPCSSICCDEDYICHIVLENKKDRAIAIFKIYLQIGWNNFLEIENFDKVPLILEPFGIYSKEYDPVDFYVENFEIIKFNDYLMSRSVRKKIVLSTSQGKYKVKKYMKQWYPLTEYFNNYMTSIVYALRSDYNGRSYGGNVQYIVDFIFNSNKHEVVPIYSGDYRIKKFQNFQLSKEALINKSKLDEFLNDQIAKGNLNCIEFKILDMAAICKEKKKGYRLTRELKNYNWFMYFVYGRIRTYILNLLERLKY